MSEVRQRHAGDGDTENEKDSVLQPEVSAKCHNLYCSLSTKFVILDRW